jgi:hypothetical protein
MRAAAPEAVRCESQAARCPAAMRAKNRLQERRAPRRRSRIALGAACGTRRCFRLLQVSYVPHMDVSGNGLLMPRNLQVRRSDGRVLSVRIREASLGEEANLHFGKLEAAVACPVAGVHEASGWTREPVCRTNRQSSNNVDHEVSQSGLSLADKAATVNGMLWSDAHAPKAYTELLGDDRMHRELLRWLVSWSQYRDVRSTSGASFRNGTGACRRFTAPLTPLAVLAGPPASCKTACVRVLAERAGLEMWEPHMLFRDGLNCAENRFAEVLGSASLRTGRPRLVVVDEGVLPTEAFASLKRSAGNASANTIHWSDVLVRVALTLKSVPVLFVLDDAHCREARILRAQGAVIFTCSRPGLQPLKRRLEQVTRHCGLKFAESAFLEHLALALNCDIRACLNQLQLIGACQWSDGLWSTIGLRDAPGPLREQCSQIFRVSARPASYMVQTGAGGVRNRATGTASDDSERDIPHRPAFGASQSPDLWKRQHFLSGEIRDYLDMCFENYLAVVPFDPLMRRCSAAVDWHSCIDSMIHNELVDSMVLETLGLAALQSYRYHCGRSTAPVPHSLKLARFGCLDANSPMHTRNRDIIERYRQALIEDSSNASVRQAYALSLRREGVLVFIPLLVVTVQAIVEATVAEKGARRAELLRHLGKQLSSYALRWAADDDSQANIAPEAPSGARRWNALPLEPAIADLCIMQSASYPECKREGVRALQRQFGVLLRNCAGQRVRSARNVALRGNALHHHAAHPLSLPVKRDARISELRSHSDGIQCIVRYQYREGHTNAVLRPCLIEDLL